MTQETVVSENKREILHKSFVHEILNILFDVQNKGLATVFCDLSGHVRLLSVTIYFPVWVNKSAPSYTDDIYFDTAGYERLLRFKFNLTNYIKSIS